MVPSRKEGSTPGSSLAFSASGRKEAASLQQVVVPRERLRILVAETEMVLRVFGVSFSPTEKRVNYRWQDVWAS